MSLKSTITILLLISLFGSLSAISQSSIPKADLPPSYYAQWAHSHWVWLNSPSQNQSSMAEMIQGYLSRNISVGAIDIDSEWATGNNNFIVDTAKFPDMAQLVQDCHNQDIKVILWATSMIDTDSSNYQYAVDNKYFVTSAIPFYKGDEIKWWHGKGGLLDYTNPDAVNWWHSQMDNVLNIGVDGFKTDGTDPYILELVVPWGHKGFISYRDYADMYYGDFFNYTRQVRGIDGLIMSRPVDGYGGAFINFSPRNVVFSGWVGDEDPTFDGLVQALLRIVHSAWENYVNFGSDIGGYRGGKRTKEVFIRWAQLGAFCPLMENGGEGPHLPWEFDDETVEIYRKYAVAHVELMPFFLTAGNVAWEEGNSVIQPLAAKEDDLTLSQPSTFNYILSNDILVAPISAANTTYVNIQFPNNQNNWVSYWNSTQLYQSGIQDLYLTPLDTLPVFKRAGAIIPMNVTSDYSIHGNSLSAGYLTLLISHPASDQSESKGIREMFTGGRVVNYSLTAEGFFFSSTAHDTPLIILLEGINFNAQSSGILDSINSLSLGEISNFNAFQSSSQGFFFDSSAQKLWIKYSQTSNGVNLAIKGISAL